MRARWHGSTAPVEAHQYALMEKIKYLFLWALMPGPLVQVPQMSRSATPWPIPPGLGLQWAAVVPPTLRQLISPGLAWMWQGVLMRLAWLHLASLVGLPQQYGRTLLCYPVFQAPWGLPGHFKNGSAKNGGNDGMCQSFFWHVMLRQFSSFQSLCIVYLVALGNN